MDWTALTLSLKLGGLTALLLLPVGIFLGRVLAFREFRGKGFAEAALALPLVLPPTVIGYYLLVGMGGGSWLGELMEQWFGRGLVFTFEGLVVASILVNLPFAIQPMQRAFEAIAPEVREAAAVSGMNWHQVLLRIDLPLAWPGILTGLVLVFAHTLGEFGVVLMVGGAIPGETQTMAIAIYDRVQAFDNQAAGTMSAFLLLLSFVVLGLIHMVFGRRRRQHG